MHKNVVFDGECSYTDHGITVNSFDPGVAERAQLRESVAYMDGDWDFSFIGGGAVYKNRTVTIVFNLTCESGAALALKLAELNAWLGGKSGDMQFEGMPGVTFQDFAPIVGKKKMIGTRAAQVTVKGEASPYVLIDGQEVII